VDINKIHTERFKIVEAMYLNGFQELTLDQALEIDAGGVSEVVSLVTGGVAAVAGVVAVVCPPAAPFAAPTAACLSSSL